MLDLLKKFDSFAAVHFVSLLSRVRSTRSRPRFCHQRKTSHSVLVDQREKCQHLSRYSTATYFISDIIKICKSSRNIHCHAPTGVVGSTKFENVLLLRCSEITVRPSTRELIQRGIEPEPATEDLWSADQARPPHFKTPIKPQLHLLEAQPAHFECRLVPINDPTMEVSPSGAVLRGRTCRL